MLYEKHTAFLFKKTKNYLKALAHIYFQLFLCLDKEAGR